MNKIHENDRRFKRNCKITDDLGLGLQFKTQIHLSPTLRLQFKVAYHLHGYQ